VVLQPRIPADKCSPIVIIDHHSAIGKFPTGIAIPKQIDQIAEIAHAFVSRVFIGADGDPRFKRRHSVFFKYWNEFYTRSGLTRVPRASENLFNVLPLLFIGHEAKTAIDRERALDICGRRPASSNPSQSKK
jgi:hypothetical protein